MLSQDIDLPEADHVIHITDSETMDCFTIDQLRDYGAKHRLKALEDAAQCSEDTVTALSGLPDVDRLIKLGDDIAFNIRKMKG